MRLTTFGDYGLRLLMHLTTTGDEWTSVREVAAFHGASREHFAKVAHRLAREGWVQTRRGRAGGLRLACDPNELTVAEVLRALDPPGLLDCFEDDDACKLTAGCGLRGALRRAELAFYASLETTSLMDCVPNPERLFPISAAPRHPAAASPPPQERG